METKIKQIKEELKAFEEDTYLKKNLLSEMLLLQDQIVSSLFGAHNSHTRLKDVVEYFTELNKEKGNVADDLLESFSKQTKTFTNLIITEKSGLSGENKAFTAIRNVTKNHKTLRNVELKVDDLRAEIDLLTFTNDAIYLIEVKNTGRNIFIDDKGNYYRESDSHELHCNKNIGEKMNEKESVLRATLEANNFYGVDIVSVLVFTNTTINVSCEYSHIKTCFVSQLPHFVDGFLGENQFSDAKMCKLYHIVSDATNPEGFKIDFDVSNYKETFAKLKVTLDNAPAVEKKSFKKIFSRIIGRIAKAACLIFN